MRPPNMNRYLSYLLSNLRLNVQISSLNTATNDPKNRPKLTEFLFRMRFQIVVFDVRIFLMENIKVSKNLIPYAISPVLTVENINEARQDPRCEQL